MSSASPRPTCRPTSPPAAARRSPTWAPVRHDAAADLPRALQRAERRQRRQPGALHRRQLDQRDVPRLPRRAQPESVGLCEHRHQRPGRQHHAAQQRDHGRLAGELLRRQSRSARRREPRRPTPAPARARTRDSSSSASASRTASPSPPATRSAWRSCSSATAFTKPLEWIDQAGQVGNVRHALKANWSLEVPVGRGSEVRRRHERLPRRDRRRLVGGRRRPHPDRRGARLRQRPAGRHDAEGSAEGDQGPAGTGRTDLHPAGRHPRQHREGVLGQRHLGERLRLERRADRPLLRAGERPGLHRIGARPTATAACAA